jgi:hypothetical protein
LNPNFTTIITPIEPSKVEWCRGYLRDNADPQFGGEAAFLECCPLFPFDKIAGLHFCSFVILDAADGGGPCLVFEATFDGPRAGFLDELLKYAPIGFDEVYRRCVGYPLSGTTTPNLVREYWERHDVGANTFFSGSPGRTVVQVKGENSVRKGIVSFLSARFLVDAILPGRPAGLLDLVTRECIRGSADNRWAEQPAQLPWQMTLRTQIAVAAGIVVALLACALGALVCWALGYRPSALYAVLPLWLETVGHATQHLDTKVSALPWVSQLTEFIQPATLTGLMLLSVMWLVVRAAELLLRSASKNTRDQHLFWRFPLQLAVVTRYALLGVLIGVVTLAVISGVDRSPTWAGILVDGPSGILMSLGAVLVVMFQLVCIGGLLLVGWYCTTSLQLMVELQPLSKTRENLRRMALDVIQFAMFLLVSVGVLLVAALLPETVISNVAGMARSLTYGWLLMVLLGWSGVMAGYLVGLLALCVIGALEYRDRTTFEHPAGLLIRARDNARKYAREEAGINRYQNHLASITCVKPGVLRYWILRLVLFAVNVLAKFWFNKGELGGIPTILSARWVLIDGGRRLLFLDNFGGAWESYLNEFIDLAAVKGLNAIWTNTFVNAAGKRYGFPPTRFLFWQGAQDARPFKAYVRQSQVETIVWYGAYPMLGVVGINANTDTRQDLFAPLSSPAIDRFLQRL